jgi:hypothetical protein
MRKIPEMVLGATLLILCSCNPFIDGYRHGATWSEAVNRYHLITGNAGSLGDKRLVANKGFHKRSELSNFLNCNCKHRGLPDFIYEYQNEKKCRGIRLYYVKQDSVFIFEEPRKNNLQSVLKEARKMFEYERLTYDRLKAAK